MRVCAVVPMETPERHCHGIRGMLYLQDEGFKITGGSYDLGCKISVTINRDHFTTLGHIEWSRFKARTLTKLGSDSKH